MAFYRAVNSPRRSPLVTIFERFDHITAMRIAKGLGVLREYIRGDEQVIADIADSFELYEAMFPPPQLAD